MKMDCQGERIIQPVCTFDALSKVEIPIGHRGGSSISAEALWDAITARIQSDGGVMHKSSMLAVFRALGAV